MLEPMTNMTNTSCTPAPCLLLPAQDIAAHYQVGHVSLLEPMTNMTNSGLAARLGITQWELVSRFYKDWVRCRPCGGKEGGEQ